MRVETKQVKRCAEAGDRLRGISQSVVHSTTDASGERIAAVAMSL